MSDEIKILNGRKYQKKNGQWFDIGPADVGTPQVKSLNGRKYEKRDGQWYDIGESEIKSEEPVKKKDGGTEFDLAGVGGQSTSPSSKLGTSVSEFSGQPESEDSQSGSVFSPSNRMADSMSESAQQVSKNNAGASAEKLLTTGKGILDEVGVKIMNSEVTGEDIGKLSRMEGGDKYISYLVEKFAPELGGMGYTDDIFRSDVKRERLAKAIQAKTREDAVKRQGEYFTSVDEYVNDIIQNYEVEDISVSGGTGGAAVNVTKKKLPLINLSDTKKIGELMAEISSSENIVGPDKDKLGKNWKEDILSKLSQKMAFLKANQPISEEILSKRDQIKNAITAIDPSEIDTKYDHILSGLNYVKDASPGYYDIVMRTINNKGKIAETDYNKLGLIGQNISNQKKFISSAQDKELIGTETNLNYVTYQNKKQQYAAAIGEYLKSSGFKNYRKFSEKQIKQAAINLGLTDQEVINDLVDDEGILGYDAIPKSGWREMIASGVMKPFDAIKKTADAIFMSPENFHLKHQQFDVGIGGQKVAGKDGEMSTRLPSDRGNIWYDALEGFGQFIPQVLLARGIGSPVAGATRSATSLVPRATLTAAQEAAIVNYGGTFISTYLQEYGSSYQDALQKTGDPRTARSMAAINGISAASFELFLPDTKIAQQAAGIFKKNYAGDIIDIIKKGGDPSELARKGRGVIEKFVGETFKIAKQEVKEEVGTNIANYLTEAIFIPKTAADRNLGEEILETAKATAVSMLIPSVLGGAGASVNKDFTVNGLHAGAINLNEYKASLEKALLNDQISQKEYNDGIKMLSTHRQSIKSSPFESSTGKVLSKSERLEYAYQETVVKALNEQLEAATSDVTKEDIKAKIEKAQSVQKEILGIKIEAKEGEEQVKADPEYKSRTISIDEENDLYEEIEGDELKAAMILGKADLPKVFMTGAEQDPLGTLRDISYQAQGIVINTETGEQELHPIGNQRQALINMGVPETVIDKAIEMFPLEQPTVSGKEIGRGVGGDVGAKNKAFEELVNLIPTTDLRRPNGSIGTQGFSPENLVEVARHIAKEMGFDIPAYDKNKGTSEIKQVIDYLKNNKEAQQKIRDYVVKDPVVVSLLPDNTYEIEDGNHRANLLNLIGVDVIPTIELNGRDKQTAINEHNSKVEAVEQSLPTQEAKAEQPTVSDNPALANVEATAKALEDIERRRQEELYKTNLYEYDRKFKEFQTYGNTVKEAFDNLFEQVKNNPTNKELSDLLDYINERLVPEDIQKGSGKNPLVQEYIDENQQSIEKASKSTKSTISKINAKYDAELAALKGKEAEPTFEQKV
ncbi:MAG TPA: hypothetical protein PKI55_10695, partial [Chitinophagaceae bacterium]|nr:hypothetical protein [Chitinophagaceae bacterium]